MSPSGPTGDRGPENAGSAATPASLPSRSWLWAFLLIGALIVFDGLGAFAFGAASAGAYALADAVGKLIVGVYLAVSGALGLQGRPRPRALFWTIIAVLGACLMLWGDIASGLGSAA